ncbi:MAG TPA: hypothetical protein VIH76_19620 [Candidatus Acidoferrales bacterium]
MSTDSVADAARARQAPAEEIPALVHDKNEVVLVALLENPALDESHVHILIQRLDISATVVAAVAQQTKWLKNESLRLALAVHPHTPPRVANPIVRQLFVFDLVHVSLAPSAQPETRRIAEEMLIGKIPQIPIGQKLTLARRGPSRVAGAIIQEGHVEATTAALGNPFLAESQILKVLAMSGTPARVVTAIAEHPKWSCHYNVRLALVRNRHTPLRAIMAFLPNLTAQDLKDISTLPGIPPNIKVYIQREVARRTSSRGKIPHR